MIDRAYTGLWYASITMALLGVGAVATGRDVIGLALVAVGGSLLALAAIGSEFRIAIGKETGATWRTGFTFVMGLLFTLAVAFSTGVLPSEAPISVRSVVLATGVQALAVTIDSHPARMSRTARVTMLATGHGAVFAGSLLALEWGPGHETGAILLYTVGFPVLILHGFWIRTNRTTVGSRSTTAARRWEALLLLAIICGVPSTLVVSLTVPATALLPTTPLTRALAVVAGGSAIVALASLSTPATSPTVLRRFTGPRAAITQHAAVALLLVNTFVFAVFLLLPGLFLWVLGGFVLLLLASVTVNYLMLLHARQSLSTDPPPLLSADAMAVSVIVVGFNEAEILQETLEHNLAVLEDCPFILVPAVKSTDGTEHVMQRYQAAHSDRVEVVAGTSGSKAGDLNLAWDHIETPYALVLDADETVGPEFISRGIEQLEAQPTVGIVQGRKVATYPTQRLLARFVTIERQHNTLLDQWFMSDRCNAGHFAGSAALIRREVPTAVGGWDPTVLTEDIDLTLRLYVQTEWQHAYDPEMVAHELNPRTWVDLLHQRERWARGWAQVAVRHGTELLRSWRRLGVRQTSGVSWKLFTAVSAPLYTIFPAVALYWSLGLAPAISPLLVALSTVWLLPERGLSFAYTAVRDPAITTPRRRLGSVIGYAYAWIVFMWIVQLHSLYLQLSGREQVWHHTTKQPPQAEAEPPQQTDPQPSQRV